MRRLPLVMLAASTIAALGVLLSAVEPEGTHANHAWTHDQGVGFDGIGPDFGWVNIRVMANTTSFWSALEAVDSWRAKRVGDVWWYRFTDQQGEMQAEVIDSGQPSGFSAPYYLYHTLECISRFTPTPMRPLADQFWASAIVTNSAGFPAGFDSSGFYAQGTTAFVRGTACLNPQQPNNAGTIAHELGHILGLDHVSSTTTDPYGNVVYGFCADTGRNSVMAYIYDAWGAQWPPSPRHPTSEDVFGPWVCNTAYPGGLNYIYNVASGGVGGATSVPTDTPTPTRTFTPTFTHTPTHTPTPTNTPMDIDGDGFLNPTPPGHFYINTNTAYDNCPSVSNPGQINTDGNFVDNSPPWPTTADDKTNLKSDKDGDACDADDDNDGWPDMFEVAGFLTFCTGIATDPLDADTDDDLFLDGPECLYGGDPTNPAIVPAVSGCLDQTDAASATTDTDGDLIRDWVEYCKYLSGWTDVDSDGDATLDGGDDGCEVASFNGDRIVNPADQGMIASAIIDATKRHPNLDTNKDGLYNPADQGFVASYFGECP